MREKSRTCRARPLCSKRGGRPSTVSICTEATQPVPPTLNSFTSQLSQTSTRGCDSGPSFSGEKTTERRPCKKKKNPVLSLCGVNI